LVLFAAVLVLAGCSRDLGPKTYTAEVRDNYQQNCVAGSTQKLSASDAAAYCECTYTGLEKNIAFDHFKDFEEYLRQHVGDDVNSSADLASNVKYADIVGVLAGCVSQGPSSPTMAPTTSTAR
jgi:hypothetical protein